MAKIETKLFNTSVEDAFKILYHRLQSYEKSIEREKIRNDYPDGITRTVTFVDRLGNPYFAEKGKITFSGHSHIMRFPSLTDLTAAEIEAGSISNYNDALVFTGFQTQADVLLEVKYDEMWRELVDSILFELIELFPEPEIAQPFPADQPGQVDIQRSKEVTVRQIDNVVQACLHTIKGWGFKRSIQGATILYTIWSNTETKKLPLGVFRVWEWHDGGGRCGWLNLENATSEQERLRNVFHMQMIVPILVQANADLSSITSTDQLGQFEKSKEKNGRKKLSKDDPKEFIYRIAKAQEATEIYDAMRGSNFTWRNACQKIGWSHGSDKSGVKLLEYARSELKQLERSDPDNWLEKVKEFREKEKKETT